MTPDRILERLATLYPKIIDLSLERVRRLMAELGDPQERLPPVIHVAGTNGKGSTVAYLRAILEASGYRVHAYISPHLVRFNERIRLAGRLIDDEALAELLTEVERVNAQRPITFFEVTTAAAFLAFARVPADVVLLETGLGGRLDATNLVSRPAACALTPISLDHFEHLGDTLEKIAAEKAGILKAGVTAVVGPQLPEAAAVLERVAAERGAPLLCYGREWRIEPTASGFLYLGDHRALELPTPGLPGRHQLDNAGLAVAVIESLPAFSVEDDAIRRGLMEVEWPARLQRLTRGPLAALLPPGVALFLDGGHNENAGEAIATWLRSGPAPVDAVVGMRGNKAVRPFLTHLAPYLRRLRAVPIPGDSFTMAPEAIVEAGREAGIQDASAAASVAAAISDLARVADLPRRLLICGSLYLAGTVLAEIPPE